MNIHRIWVDKASHSAEETHAYTEPRDRTGEQKNKKVPLHPTMPLSQNKPHKKPRTCKVSARQSGGVVQCAVRVRQAAKSVCVWRVGQGEKGASVQAVVGCGEG